MERGRVSGMSELYSVWLQFTEPEDFISSVVTQPTIRQPFWFIAWVSLENHDPVQCRSKSEKFKY